MCRTLALALAALAVCVESGGAPVPDGWLRQVSPIITTSERSRYLALPEAEKPAFHQHFWASRSVEPQEYFLRLAHADAVFGSGAMLSGLNTDRGRVFLALGAPNRTTRLASTRTFVPIEIWYFDEQGLQLIFFTRREGSEPQLYSPTLHSIRALLLPNSSNRTLFPVNDAISENDVRNRMTLSPSEEEVVDAALRLKRGVTGLGNEELIARVLSPREMLNQPPKTAVRSRLVAAGEVPAIEVQTSHSGADIAVRCNPRATVRLQLLAGTTPVDDAETSLTLARSQPVLYLHRYALPAGDYTVRAECDGRPASTTFHFAPDAPTPIRTGTLTAGTGPFQLPGHGQLIPSAQRPTHAATQGSGEVRWRIFRGSQLVWNTTAHAADGWSLVELPSALLEPAGSYEITAGGDRSARLTIAPKNSAGEPLVVSYRANLNPESEALLGSRIALARGDLKAARTLLASAGTSDALLTARARIQALTGDLDGARSLLEQVLQHSPNHSEALAALGFVSFEFQDYVMAERYLRKAIEQNPNPAWRSALAQIVARRTSP